LLFYLKRIKRKIKCLWAHPFSSLTFVVNRRKWGLRIREKEKKMREFGRYFVMRK